MPNVTHQYRLRQRADRSTERGRGSRVWSPQQPSPDRWTSVCCLSGGAARECHGVWPERSVCRELARS
jgi:hypothetical protein